MNFWTVACSAGCSFCTFHKSLSQFKGGLEVSFLRAPVSTQLDVQDSRGLRHAEVEFRHSVHCHTRKIQPALVPFVT